MSVQRQGINHTRGAYLAIETTVSLHSFAYSRDIFTGYRYRIKSPFWDTKTCTPQAAKV